MLNSGLKNKVCYLEENITKIQDYQHLQQEQVTDLLDLIETQGLLIAQLQTDVLHLKTDRDNWRTLLDLLS